MKQIRESFDDTQNIVDFMKSNLTESRVDEGWKDFVNSVKAKFKQVFEYLKGLVVKAGSYFLPVDEEGHVEPAITPLTAGQAYMDGLINKNSTLVVMDREGKKITKCRTKFTDALKLYGSGDSISYWEQLLKESDERNANNPNAVNEVKLESDDPEAKYNKIIDNNELLEEVEMHLTHPELNRLMIWGAPGIGKTAILMGVIDKMKQKFPDYRLIVKTLSNETPDNFTLPKYIDIEGQEFATDVPKTWLPVYKPSGDMKKDRKLDEKCGRGLLFIDELSRATPQVLNVILPLVNEGIFNGYQLGSGWTIICASNRAEDEMSGQANIGNALANRFTQVFYEPTVKSWTQWAKKQNFISPLLITWLEMPESENMAGGKFFYMDPNENMDSVTPTTLMCTPRSWTNAMRKLACYSNTGDMEGFTIFDIPDRILKRTLNGSVPASAVEAFMAFLAVVREIGDFDQAVEQIWKTGTMTRKINKKSMSLISLPLAQMICAAHGNELPTGKEFENLCKWLVSTGSIQVTSYVLDIIKTIFGSTIDPTYRDEMFAIVGKRDKPKQQKVWPIYKQAFKEFEAKWGVNIDDDTMPDYLIGLRVLRAAFKEDFTIKIEDRDALG